jgi:hypothetical protein
VELVARFRSFILLEMYVCRGGISALTAEAVTGPLSAAGNHTVHPVAPDGLVHTKLERFIIHNRLHDGRFEGSDRFLPHNAIYISGQQATRLLV